MQAPLPELRAAQAAPLVPGRPAFAAWVAGLAIGGAGAVGTAAAWDLATTVHLASWLLVGFVAVPLLLLLVGLPVATTLTVIAGVLALPSWLRGRTTGLRDLAAEAFALPLAVVPRYAAALRNANRPVAFGTAAGFAFATAWMLAAGGRAPC